MAMTAGTRVSGEDRQPGGGERAEGDQEDHQGDQQAGVVDLDARRGGGLDRLPDGVE
jgi:hypothetical protein